MSSFCPFHYSLLSPVPQRLLKLDLLLLQNLHSLWHFVKVALAWIGKELSVTHVLNECYDLTITSHFSCIDVKLFDKT